MAWLGLRVILGEWLGPVGASRFTEEDLRLLWDGGKLQCLCSLAE